MSITCPTCKLLNNDDDMNCRRCFSPLVVTVRGGISGGTKAYSRKFIELATRNSKFSLIRIAIASLVLSIAGLLLYNAAQRTVQDQSHLVVSQPEVTRILQMAVKYQKDQLLVTNNDDFDWETVELVINQAISEDGKAENCCWKLIIPVIKSHDTVLLGVSSFKNGRGDIFITSANELKNLQVSCYVKGRMHKAAAKFK
jgi:hypothetical protein